MSIARRFEPSDIQQRGVIGSTSYNMFTAPDESYYAEQYWNAMLPYFSMLPKNASALDLGCSQGRLTTMLARFFSDGQVTGCDLSAEAIHQAREYAAVDSIVNINFCAQSIDQCLGDYEDESVDVVVMTEVTIFYPEWERDLPRIVRILKTGGILICSFRSQYFDALCLVRSRMWESVEPVLRNRQGPIFGSPIVFTWQTSAEITEILAGRHGLELLDLRGIGVCSGIPGDPHDVICQPSQLSNAEREQLMKLEVQLGKTVPDGGRYILAIARKPDGVSV